jgi:hypothetical protein
LPQCYLFYPAKQDLTCRKSRKGCQDQVGNVRLSTVDVEFDEQAGHEKTMLKTALGITGAITVGFIILPLLLHEYPKQLACEVIQSGVWAPNGAVCITESCYETGTCRVHTLPAASCGDVRIGDRISRVVLHLGEPMHSEENRLYWHWDKTSPSVGVEALFKDDYLISLDCKAFPFINQ